MKTTIILEIKPGMSDTELRELAADEPLNGEYTSEICKSCGSFWQEETGNVKTAKILSQCKNCFDLHK